MIYAVNYSPLKSIWSNWIFLYKRVFFFPKPWAVPSGSFSSDQASNSFLCSQIQSSFWKYIIDPYPPGIKVKALYRKWKGAAVRSLMPSLIKKLFILRYSIHIIVDSVQIERFPNYFAQ
jgi:hypothetical protein